MRLTKVQSEFLCTCAKGMACEKRDGVIRGWMFRTEGACSVLTNDEEIYFRLLEDVQFLARIDLFHTIDLENLREWAAQLREYERKEWPLSYDPDEEALHL